MEKKNNNPSKTKCLIHLKHVNLSSVLNNGEVSLKTFVITRRGLRGSCVGFITRGKAGWLQISRGTGVCLGGRGPTEDKGSGFSPCSIPGRPGDSAWLQLGAAVGLPHYLPSEITLIIFFYFFFPVHISTPSCLLPMKPKFLVWMETRGKRAVAPHGVRAGGDIWHGAFGARGCSKTPTRGGVEGTQLPLCMGVMPVREAPSPGLKLNRDQ